MAIGENFWDKLKEKYGEAWVDEGDKVKKILYTVETNIQDRYEIDSPINIGGAGIVIKVLDKNLGVHRALKCARPVAGKESLLTDIIASEISRLIESSHPNIVSIFYQGEVSCNGEKRPYYVMEYISGALDAFDFIEKHKPDYCQIIR